MASRRQFLRIGIAGAIALAAAGVFLLPDGGRMSARLDRGRRALLAAVSGALLGPALPGEGREAALEALGDRIERAIGALSAPAQRELAELLAALDFAPARFALTGIGVPWARAEEVEVARFLERWRASRYPMLRSAYQALHDLVIGSWYAGRETWATIGYPGPPEIP